MRIANNVNGDPLPILKALNSIMIIPKTFGKNTALMIETSSCPSHLDQRKVGVLADDHLHGLPVPYN